LLECLRNQSSHDCVHWGRDGGTGRGQVRPDLPDPRARRVQSRGELAGRREDRESSDRV
jgi:hypothetical protein